MNKVAIVTGAGRGFSAGLDLQDQGTAPGADGVRRTVGAFMWQDHLATLHERIKTVERELLIETVAALAANGCTVTGRKVTIP